MGFLVKSDKKFKFDYRLPKTQKLVIVFKTENLFPGFRLTSLVITTSVGCCCSWVESMCNITFDIVFDVSQDTR